MLLITGVDSVESSSRQNATKNRIDRGVAGRSMAASLGIRGCGPPETGSRDSAWWWWWASERTKHRRRLVRWNMRMRGRSRKRATRDAPEVKRRVARAMLAVAWRPRWTAHTRRRGRARGEGAQLGGWQRSAGERRGRASKSGVGVLALAMEAAATAREDAAANQRCGGYERSLDARWRLQIKLAREETLSLVMQRQYSGICTLVVLMLDAPLASHPNT